MITAREQTDNAAPGGMPASVAWIAVLVLCVAAIQWAIPYPLDDDTAYHFAVARLMREHGILQSFPWTRFSWQLDHYADKEFLFHLLFVPFTRFGFNVAARIVGTIAAVAIPVAGYLVLRAEKVRFAGLWALLPFGTTIFLYRFCQVRPHLVSIALAVLLLWAYCRRRMLLLGLTALLYPLFYVAFWQLPLILIVAAETARLLAGETFKWRPLACVLAGIAAGLSLHPNSFNLVQINWIHMTDILIRNAWGKHIEFNMGEEFEPFYLAQWLQFLLPAAGMALFAVYRSWRKRLGSMLPLAFALATMLFSLLTMGSNRFLEYFVPFAVLSLALALGSAVKHRHMVLLFGLSAAHTLFSGIPTLKYITSPEPRLWQMDTAVVRKLEKEVPLGADVFTCGWEYSGTLMVNFPDRHYMVALDPTLLYKRDPALYTLWYRTLRDGPQASAEIVRKSFASRYVICLDHSTLHPFFDALVADRSRVLHSDGKWVVFDLGE